MKKLDFIALNELNFEVVKKYIDGGIKLNNFSKIIENMKQTSSENNYEELEPWIQWYSAFTGKSYRDHGVFRLGDGANSDCEDVFEALDKKGFCIGAICPMNIPNRTLFSAYFVPDPWTETLPNKSFSSNALHKIGKQSVNDNSSGRITKSTYLLLIYMFIVHCEFYDKLRLIKYYKRIDQKSWRKAIFFDLLLWSIFKKWRKRSTNLDFIFLNAGAHIQHHYFFNSPYADTALTNPPDYIDPKDDPLLEVLTVYDQIIGDVLRSGTDYLMATGLSQVPYDREKYYYRLLDHAEFLRTFEIRFSRVLPRMSRDFEILFENSRDLELAKIKLERILINQSLLFERVEITDDGLFVTLTYPKKIEFADVIWLEEISIDACDATVFVALKNGMHCSTGYVSSSPAISYASDNSHILSLKGTILNYFAS